MLLLSGIALFALNQLGVATAQAFSPGTRTSELIEDRYRSRERILAHWLHQCWEHS